MLGSNRHLPYTKSSSKIHVCRQGGVPAAWSPAFNISLMKQPQIDFREQKFQRGEHHWRKHGKAKFTCASWWQDKPNHPQMSEKMSVIGDTEVAAVQASSMEHPYRIHLLSFFLKLCVFPRKLLSHMGGKVGCWDPAGCNCCPGSLDGEMPLGIESRWEAVSPVLQEKDKGSKCPQLTVIDAVGFKFCLKAFWFWISLQLHTGH